MIRNVIFDLGGVLLGRDFESYSGEKGPFGFLYGDRPFPQWWKDFDRGIVSQSHVSEAIAAETGCPVCEADAMVTGVGIMFNEFPQTVRLVEELHRKGYRLYVLSNMPLEFWERMKQLPIFQCFDGIVISSNEKLSKPDPRIFSLLLQRHGLEAGETLFVDDKPTNTAPASTMGMYVCLFDTDKGPDKVREILKDKGIYG